MKPLILVVGVVAVVSVALIIGLSVGLTRDDDDDDGKDDNNNVVLYECEDLDFDDPEKLKDLKKKVRLSNSDEGAVCLLTIVKTSSNTKKDFVVPLGRSYDGNEWEVVPPFYVHLECDDDDDEDDCTFTLPKTTDQEKFYLTKLKHSISEEEEVSRLLNQATFGATKQMIDDYISSDSTPASFVRDQMDLPASEHRVTFRSHSSSRMINPEPTGKPRHPCEANSRWRQYSLVQNSVERPVTIKHLLDGAYLFSVGNLPKTEVLSVPRLVRWEGDPEAFDMVEGYVYYLPRWGVYEQRVGGPLRIRNNEEDPTWYWVEGGNPVTQFPNWGKRSVYDGDLYEGVVVLDISGEEGKFEPMNEKYLGDNELILTSGLSKSACDSLSRFDLTQPIIAIQVSQSYSLLHSFLSSTHNQSWREKHSSLLFSSLFCSFLLFSSLFFSFLLFSSLFFSFLLLMSRFPVLGWRLVHSRPTSSLGEKH
jgi:hypothetical protein